MVEMGPRQVLAHIPSSLLLLRVVLVEYPPIQYIMGGCEEGFSSHPTIPALLKFASEQQPPLKYSRGACEVGISFHSTIDSTLVSRMSAASSSSI